MATFKIMHLLLSAIALCSALQTSSAQTQKVCSLNNLSPGWVIINLDNCLCCGAEGAPRRTRWTIKKISGMPTGSTVQVCSLQNVPTGWGTISQTQCLCCGAEGSNRTRWTIKKL